MGGRVSSNRALVLLLRFRWCRMRLQPRLRPGICCLSLLCQGPHCPLCQFKLVLLLVLVCTYVHMYVCMYSTYILVKVLDINTLRTLRDVKKTFISILYHWYLHTFRRLFSVWYLRCLGSGVQIVSNPSIHLKEILCMYVGMYLYTNRVRVCTDYIVLYIHMYVCTYNI